MMKVYAIVASGVLVAALFPATQVEDDGPYPFLRFANRNEHVELEKTRGAFDLQKPFTIELWVRWNTDILKMMYLAGDEAWPGMSRNIQVEAECGWVIRTTKVQDADKQAVDFTVAASARGKRDWLRVITPLRRIQPGQWQHIAVCRTASELRIYWDGNLATRRSIAGITLHNSPSNVFLGVRRNGWEDREFVGDIRAFQITAKARYNYPFKPEMPLKRDEAAIVFLDFSTANDSQVPDSSPHMRHGRIVGAKLIKPKTP
jgi:hypothetical protein